MHSPVTNGHIIDVILILPTCINCQLFRMTMTYIHTIKKKRKKNVHTEIEFQISAATHGSWPAVITQKLLYRLSI